MRSTALFLILNSLATEATHSRRAKRSFSQPPYSEGEATPDETEASTTTIALTRSRRFTEQERVESMNGIGLSGESHETFWARRNLVAAVVAAIFVFIAMLAMASPARADSFVVTTTDDTPKADAAVCDSNCSLREAVKLANSNAVADTITFDLPDAGPHTITLTNGQIFFFTTQKITLDGTGESVTVSGNNASRVFHVQWQGNLTVKRLTVSDGNATTGCCDAKGGGIYVTSSPASNLEVIDSTVSGNQAGSGGGIYSGTNLDGTGTTTIVNSTISGNTATAGPAGVAAYTTLMAECT